MREIIARLQDISIELEMLQTDNEAVDTNVSNAQELLSEAAETLAFTCGEWNSEEVAA